MYDSRAHSGRWLLWRPFRIATLAALCVGAGIAPGPGIGAIPSGSAAGPAIYNGETKQGAGLTLNAWGSGMIEENTKTVFNGSASLRIVTQGMYQGASLGFANSFSLAPYAADQTAYLQFTMQVPALAGGGAGDGGAASGGSRLGPGDPGGFDGPLGTPGAPGGRPRPGATGAAQANRALENMRILLVTTRGRGMEFLLPMAYATTENGWKVLSIPVAKIPGMKADDAEIKEIRLFGDAVAVIYVGRIGIVQDSTPISIQPLDDKTVPRNERYVYKASAAAGPTPLKFSWDWNAADGIQEESEGRQAVHAYHKSGDYVVTVTASDIYGIKAPKSVTFKVHVTL